MPIWFDQDPSDDDQDKPKPEHQPEPSLEEEPLFAKFTWWLVVLPLAVAIGVLHRQALNLLEFLELLP